MVRRQRVIDQSPENMSNADDGKELTTREISISEMHAIRSMEDAIRVFQQTSGQEVIDARDEIGDGFDYLDNKDLLVGKPLFFLKWETRYSESFKDRDGRPLPGITAWIVVEKAGGIAKVRITDFSTGVCRQLWDFSDRTDRFGGLRAPRGLRKSEFPYKDPSSNETSMAKTYYIDESPDL